MEKITTCTLSLSVHLDGPRVQPVIFQVDRWLAISREYGRKSCQGTLGEGACKTTGQTRNDRALGSRRTIFFEKNEESQQNFQAQTEHVRTDDPYDNARAESFWTGHPGGRMKAEPGMPKGGYESIEKLKSVLFECIDGYYNTRRLHSSLNYRNPAAFEAEYYRQTR